MASSSLSSSSSSSLSPSSPSSSSSSSSSAPPSSSSSPSISPETPATPTLSSLRASFITNIHVHPHSPDKRKSSTEKLSTNGNDLKSSSSDLLMIDDLTENGSHTSTGSSSSSSSGGGGGSNSNNGGRSIHYNGSKFVGGSIASTIAAASAATTTTTTTTKPIGVAVANVANGTNNNGVSGLTRVNGNLINSNNNINSSSNNSNGNITSNCKTNTTLNGGSLNNANNSNSGRGSGGGSSVTRLRSINFVNNDHLTSVFSSMNHMRKNGQLCDIILQASGSQLKAHKVVLSATSAYFNAMFNSEMSEKTKSVITLHDIEFNALKLLIDYSYSGEIVISEENVQALLPTASLLQVSAVREACCKFLLRQLDPTNCLGIRSFADAHSCEELHQTSDKFVVENFPAVAATEEFLLLPYREVEDLISSNHLNVHDENEVYNAVIRWVKFDLKSRESRLGSLLQHIRFPLIHKNTLLNHVCKEPLIEGNPDGKDLLIEAMRYHLSPDQRTNIKNVRTQYRRPKGLKTYIFAIGGGSLFAIHNECEFYDPISDTWCSFAPSFKRRSRAGVATLGRHLFAIGGYNENKELASGEFYDPIVNSWQPLAQDMGTKRSCLAIASLNGLVYVAGGYDGASCLSSVERFDPLSDMWTSVEAMTSRRRHGRLTVLDGCLYAVGGYDGTNYQSSMERFDPREGKWQLMPPMTNRRSSSGVATLSGKIYAAGGNDGSLCMNSVEKFDPTRNAWESTAPMHTRRSTHEVVEADGFLYAIGGNDGSSSLNTVERFELKKNQWIPISSMMLRRSSVGAAALECPNMEKILEALTHHNNLTSTTTPNSNTSAPESAIIH